MLDPKTGVSAGHTWARGTDKSPPLPHELHTPEIGYLGHPNQLGDCCLQTWSKLWTQVTTGPHQYYYHYHYHYFYYYYHFYYYYYNYNNYYYYDYDYNYYYNYNNYYYNNYYNNYYYNYNIAYNYYNNI